MSGGAVVATHPRLRGRKGQYSTFAEHMPESHRQESPWSRERFESWAGRVGPETRQAIVRLLDSRPMVEQAFLSCRNILALSKRSSPVQLEAACAESASGQVQGGAGGAHEACRPCPGSRRLEDRGGEPC